MTELEVIKALLMGKDILATLIDNNSCKYIYRIRHGRLQYYARAWSTRYENTEFRFLFDEFEKYTYSIYEEKPKLLWDEGNAPHYASDDGNGYFISQYGESWLLTFEPHHKYESDSFNTRKILKIHGSFAECKAIAQEHFEENN